MSEEYTQEEISNVSNALKDPKFRDLFKEYVDDISDPKHRGEYETYLSQLEAKGEVPRGRKLLRAKPGACLKTHLLFKSGQKQKLFLNLCQSSEIGEISFESSDSSKKGTYVNLPHIVSPPRPDKDSKGHTCLTCDVAVSPKTLVQCLGNPQILRVLIDIVAESLSSQFFKGNEEVSRDYKILNKTQCKGGTPLPMSVAVDNLKSSAEPEIVNTPSTDVVTPAELHQMRKDVTSTNFQVDEIEEVEETPKASYRVVEVEDMEISSFTESQGLRKPKFVKVIFTLPGICRASEISLEAGETSLSLSCEGTNFQVPLRYRVNKDSISAKFEKAKSVLTVKLEISMSEPPAVAEPGPVVAETGPVVAETGSVVAETGPVVAEPGSVVAEPGPVVAEPGSVVAEPGPVVAEPGLVVAEPGLVVAEPGPVVAEPGPVVAEPGLVVAEPGSVVAETRPVVAEPGSVVAEPGPVVAEPGPVEPGPVSSNSCWISKTSQNRENVRIVISTNFQVLPDSCELRSNRSEILLTFTTTNFARHKIHFFLAKNRSVDPQQMHATVRDLEISVVARKGDTGTWAEIVDFTRKSEGDDQLLFPGSEVPQSSQSEDLEIYSNLESFCQSIPQSNHWVFSLF